MRANADAMAATEEARSEPLGWSAKDLYVARTFVRVRRVRNQRSRSASGSQAEDLVWCSRTE